jgi:heme exporter protein C
VSPTLPFHLPDRQAALARWQRVAEPERVYTNAGLVLPWCWGAAAVLAVAGLVVALLLAPADFHQGDASRIVFIHVPAAWLSLVIYIVMAVSAMLGQLLQTRVAALLANALAPTGALMACVALWTGSLWGKPSWGTWWVWDARLTSELLLLFLYFGFLALQAATEDPRRCERACALLGLVGLVNVPVIYYSVHWWNTQHQGGSFGLLRAPNMADLTVAGLLLMAAALSAWSAAVALHRLRSLILEREGNAEWARRLPEARA